MSENGKGNARSRRLAIRVALIAALVAIAFAMHAIGKEHNVLLDNREAVIGGVLYEPIETLSLYVDGVKKNDVKAGSRTAQKMVGKNHVIAVGIAGTAAAAGKTTERAVRLDLDMRKWMISLPALAAGASDIYIPSPVTAPPPPPPETETFDPGAQEEALPGI
jgi:hypothetical protein